MTVELPEDIADRLQSDGRDLSRAALEAIALEGYRSGRLTQYQIRHLLKFEDRWQTEAFLKQHEVYDYTVKELENDRTTLSRLFSK